MKRTALIMLCLVLFSGCAKSVWETVDDTNTSAAVSSSADQTFKISFDLPEGVSLVESADGWSIYATDNGEMEIETRQFVASSVETAVEMLSGFDAADVSILELQEENISEYRFAWTTNSEQGSRICTADLFVFGVECYAIVCSTDEVSGTEYNDDVHQVFATYELLSDELV